MKIELKDLRKRFGTFEAIKGVSLEIGQGELVALLGPSGSGKTTLLRLIAGLEHADAGSVHFDGVDATTLPVRLRRVGFVFQHYALFRHMTVAENIAFGLRVRPRSERPARSAIDATVRSLLALVQLENLGHRYPAQLSGGQRQRVALARAMAIEPRVLLLDEPFGALDARVREELREWLRRLHDEVEITSVLVTHDQEEALEVADRIVVLNHGRIEQVGTPAEVYHDPANPFVCSFMGTVNVFDEARRSSGGADGSAAVGSMGALDGGADAQASDDPGWRLVCAGSDGAGAAGLRDVGHDDVSGDALANGSAPALLYARPHEIDLARVVNGGAHLPARITRVNAAGPLVRVELATDDGAPLRIDLSHERFRELGVARGDAVFAVPRGLRRFGPDPRVDRRSDPRFDPQFDQGEGI